MISIVHELGHNLGLDHGGNEGCNYKPNYNSIMNYRYALLGVDANCDTSGAGEYTVNYSYGVNRSLDENNINEYLGVCIDKIVPVDLNENGVYDISISSDVNRSDHFQEYTCGGVLTQLHDYNDWENLNLSHIYAYQLSPSEFSQRTVYCDN